MPSMILVAGPNGAGKTTFANEYIALDRSKFIYINADEIAREPELQRRRDNERDLAAGRIMLTRLGNAIAQRDDVMFETTLATRIYAQKIPVWRDFGYSVTLYYIRLPSVEHSLRRVRHRVSLGGHGIPEDVIRARFAKSTEYLEAIYKPIVDEWLVWDSLDGNFSLNSRSGTDGTQS